MTLTFYLLGACEISPQDKPAVFATNAARALLAYLATHANQPQRREHLAALLYPDQPQTLALTNLRSTLARARKSLADDSHGLVVTPQTIEFRDAAACIDVQEFEALLAECAAHTHSGTGAHADVTHCADCVARLRRAVDLYRGEFLHGLSLGHSQPFEEWLLFKREQLQRQAIDALDILTRHAEAANDFEHMAAYARRQLDIDPLREEAHLQLMRALAQAGERSAALAHYEICVRILQDELGIEPGADLRLLHERIRDGSVSRLASGAPASAPVHNLPTQLTPFIGRASELADIATQLRSSDHDARLLTLIGMGGMGKTRLAIEAARSCVDVFPDGAFFVSLAPLAEPAAIVPAIASTLNLGVQGSDLKRALLNALRTRHLLLILDNFEQVIDGAEIVADILQGAPAIRIIATSRERLNVRGERVFDIEGMAYSPGPTLADAQSSAAVRLFVQAAHRAQPAFKLNEATLPAVLRICGLVQGVPLGLELAAAWTEALSLDEIADAIEASTDFLAYDWRDLPERQRSMRAVFQWSWNLLDDAARTIFQRLSVFRGGFTREAAQAVAGASLTSLTRLAHKSLLRRGDSGRYDLHELVRQFAAEQLHASADEHAQIEARHANYFMDFLTAREQRLARHEPRQVTAEVQTELDNIRKAWAWETVHARCDGGVELDALDRNAFVWSQFYLYKGQYSEGESAFSSAVNHVQSQLRQISEESEAKQAGQDVRHGWAVLSKLLAINARFFTAAGKDDAALSLAQHAVELGIAVGAIEGQVMGHLVWGTALSRSGEHQAAQIQLEQVLQLTQLTQRNHGEDSPLESLCEAEGSAYIWMSTFWWYGNDYAAARKGLNRALRFAQSRRSLRLEVVCHLNFANCARGMRDYVSARQDYERALHMAREMDYRWGEAVALSELGDVIRMLGDYASAQQMNDHALVILRDMGDYVNEAHTTNVLARLDILCGRYVQAQARLEQIWQRIREMANPEAEVLGFISQALLSQHTDQPAQALKHADKARQLAVETGDRAQQACALTLVGHAHMSLNDVSAAASAYEQALTLFAEIGNSYQAVEPQAGLAHIALERGDLSLAQSHVESILAAQANHPRAGLDEPFFAYLACYRVLLAANDPRAALLLAQAHAVLQDYADHIGDDVLRQSFLHNVPTHRELNELWQTVGRGLMRA